MARYPWAPLKAVDVPPGGKATDHLAINVFAVELGYRTIFCEFVHHRSDGPRRPLDAMFYFDGRIEGRVGYRFGKFAFDGKFAEGAQTEVAIGERTLTLSHDPDAPNEARVRVIIT